MLIVPHGGENDSCQPTSSCPRWASRSLRAPSPSGSRRPAIASKRTSRSSRSPPTKSMRRFPRPSPACSPRSSSRRGNCQINTVVAVLAKKGPSPAKTAKKEHANPSQAAAPQGQARRFETSATDDAAGSLTADARRDIEIAMPQMGESIFEGTITKWLKKVGDTCRERRAALRDFDRQSGCGDSFARGRSADRDQSGEGETVQINAVVAVIGGQCLHNSGDAPRRSRDAKHPTAKPSAARPSAVRRHCSRDGRGDHVVAAGAADCERAQRSICAGCRVRVKRPHQQRRHSALHRSLAARPAMRRALQQPKAQCGRHRRWRSQPKWCR